MQKESFDIDILGVTFYSKMTFEKHLHSVSRGFVIPVLEHCSAVWCSATDTHLKLLDRVASGARFLTVGAFECNIAHRRYVAVL